MNLNHPLQCHLGVRLNICILEIVVPTPNFWDDKHPVTTALSPCFIDDLTFVDFRQRPCRYFLQFSHYFIHCCLCIGYSHGFNHRNKFVHKIVVTQRIHAFSWDVVFMALALRPFHAYPHQIRRPQQHKRISSSVVQLCNKFPCADSVEVYNALLLASEFAPFFSIFSWYAWILHHQVSDIIEFWLLDGQLCFSLRFRCIRHVLPPFWPHIAWSWGCLFPRKSPHPSSPPTMYIRQVALRSIKWILWNLSLHLTKSVSPSTFHSSSLRFSDITSNVVSVVLVTSMYFNGTGNDSSVGVTFGFTIISWWDLSSGWRRPVWFSS